MLQEQASNVEAEDSASEDGSEGQGGRGGPEEDEEEDEEVSDPETPDPFNFKTQLIMIRRQINPSNLVVSTIMMTMKMKKKQIQS